MKTIILDPGHGRDNRKPRVFDPGAVSNGIRECDVALDWCNELREILQSKGHKVVRTRVDNDDPAPVGNRSGIAKQYGGDIMLSIHCNSHDGNVNGTETYYRGESNRHKAADITACVCAALGTKNRGAKTEKESQHSSLAVMAFRPCFLLEIGFIDHAGDREKMLAPHLRKAACEAIAALIV